MLAAPPSHAPPRFRALALFGRRPLQRATRSSTPASENLHMCGRLQVGKENLHVAGLVKARSVDAYVIHAASVAVSREHRRAKTDRLDSELLKRAFLGWLRGERDHCKMVAIPTAKDEDAKRPNRERESLVGEQNRIINRMKAALIRLGIRGFNPKLKKAAGRLKDLRTPECEPIPPNTLAELRRDMERRRLVSTQIRQIEEARLERLEQTPSDGPHAMVSLLARVIGVGTETANVRMMSASLIGRLGSSTFRLSAAAVSDVAHGLARAAMSASDPTACQLPCAKLGWALS